MAKKIFTDESLTTFVDEIKSYTDDAVSTKANTSHTHAISDVTNLQTTLDGKAASSHTHTKSQITDFPTSLKNPNTLTIQGNGTTLTNGVYDGSAAKTVNITPSVIGAATSSHTHSDYASTVTTTGTGNAITAISQNGNTITATKGSTFLTAHPTITVGDDTTNTASPTHGGTFTTVDSVTRDGNGHVTKVNTKTVTLPAQYVHPSYTARTGVPTENPTPAFGDTFTVSQPVSDATGHITEINSRTITIPSAVVTQSDDGLMSAGDKIQLDYGGVPIVTTSGDGAAYTAAVDGMDTLTIGAKVTIIPHTVSTALAPTLNVNDLGAKAIRMPITYNTSASSNGVVESWLAPNKPITVQYNGAYWLTVDLPRPSAQYLYGVVPIENGGTGATTEADAITNLGAVDLSSDQTITGTKTFSNEIKIGNTTLAYDDTNKRLVISVVA